MINFDAMATIEQSSAQLFPWIFSLSLYFARFITMMLENVDITAIVSKQNDSSVRPWTHYRSKPGLRKESTKVVNNKLGLIGIASGKSQR